MRQPTPPLSPELIEAVYREGIFPMGEPDGTIVWYAPDPRAILPLDRVHVSQRLKRVYRKGVFEIRINFDFPSVIRACAARKETWLNEAMIRAYIALHQQGKAHSVEAYREGKLAGGLYGVALGGAFMGESMFHRETDASKVCLVALVEKLKERGYRLLDIQFMTPHLARFGAILIPRRKYLRLLQDALAHPCTFL